MLDAMQCCADKMQRKKGEGKIYANKKRQQRCVAPMNKEFCATISRIEHVTALGTWLTKNGQPCTDENAVESHFDNRNCGCAGYDITLTLNHVYEIGGELFSLKFIGNSRATIGNQFVAERAASGLSKAILRFGKRIDNETEKLMTTHYNGNSNTTMTWKKPEDMFLSDDFVYDSLDLKRKDGKSAEHQLDHINLPTAVTRDSWISPLVHWQYVFYKVTMFDEGSKRKAIDLDQRIDIAFIGAYQSSYSNSCKVLNQMWESNDSPENLFIEFLRRAIDVFQTPVGGTMPRFSSPGVKFDEVYLLSEDGPLRLKAVRQKLKKLLKSVNDLMNLPDKDLTVHGKVPMGLIRELISRTNSELKDMGLSTEVEDEPLEGKSQTTVKPELGEFRLMLFIQACSLCQIIIKPNRHIRDFVYPAKGLASMKHILANVDEDEIELTDDDIDEIMAATANELGINPWCRDMMETCFCEAYDIRGEKRRDLFFKGQFMFRLDLEGQVWYKPYNKIAWIQLSADTSIWQETDAPIN